jgi:arsenite-transporting ATPase
LLFLLGPNGRPRYDRIVIDTAPTGHTIRLLQLPEFLNSVTGKLIKFRFKLMTAVDTFKNLFGGNQAANNTDMGGALSKLESLQARVARVKETLQNPSLTQFVVVTIPTSLAVAESKRLVSSLQKENIKVSSILCNQVITEDLGLSYMQTRSRAQRRCIDVLNRATTDPAISGETEGKNLYPKIEVTEVPYVDTEVTGIFGLKYFSQIAHNPKANTATNPMDSKKLTVFGGKGGVGKTTSAASWAVSLSVSGLKTLVISTDPAHSLGDAFLEKLNGVPRLLDQSQVSSALILCLFIGFSFLSDVLSSFVSCKTYTFVYS